MQINVLIPTIDERISLVHNVFSETRSDVSYIISHQYTEEKFKVIPQELLRPDVMVSHLPGKGLSRNRNNALELADGDLGVISDDDVRYLPDSFEMVKRIFIEDPSLDVACFKIKTEEGEKEYKDYPESSVKLNRFKHHYVSSIEIVFRIGSVKAKYISFDERFGLGSERIHSGEESVFVEDCIKAGLHVRYFPYYFVCHPYTSSGKDTTMFDKTKNIMRGAYQARVLGWKAIPLAFYDTIRFVLLLIRLKRNPIVYLYERMEAIFYIFLTNRRNLRPL